MSRPLNLAILTILLGLVLMCSSASSPSNHFGSHQPAGGMRLKKWYTWNNDLEVTKKWYDWQNVPHALQQKRHPFDTTDYIIE